MSKLPLGVSGNDRIAFNVATQLWERDSDDGGNEIQFAADTVQDLELLTTADGVVVGSIGLIRATGNLYRATASTAVDSTWEPVTKVRDVADYGASTAATGAANTVAMQAAIDAAALAGGGRVIVGPGAFSTLNQIDIAQDVDFEGAGPSATVIESTLNDNLSNSFSVNTNSRLANLRLAVTAAAAVPPAGDRHIPIEIGDFSAPYDAHGWVVENLEIDGTGMYLGANGILAAGPANTGRISSIRFDDNINIARPIFVTYSHPGNTDVRYPYNILVEEVHAEGIDGTDGAAAVLFCSGAFNITFLNCYARGSYRLFRYYIGDYGPGELVAAYLWQSEMVGRGISVIDCSGDDLFDGCFADGEVGVTTAGVVRDSPILFENVHVRGRGTGAGVSANGWVLDNVKGARLEGCSAQNFTSNGVVTVEDLDDISIDGDFSFNGGNGIRLRDTAGTTQNVRISGRVRGNGIDGTASNANRAGIHISGTVLDVLLQGIELGETGELAQTYGVRVDANTVLRVTARDCFVFGAVFNGFSIGAAADWNIDFWMDSCSAAAGVTLRAGARPRQRVSGGGQFWAWADVIPTAGTWTDGSVVWYENATAGAAPGAVCVVAGTPGTWKDMAILAP